MRARYRPSWSDGAVASSWAAPILVALTLSGFWLYLGALDLVGREPFSALTAAYYAGVGLAMLAAAWSTRHVLRERLRSGTHAFWAWALSAATLGAWFLVTAVARSDGTYARDAAILLVISTLPSALLVLLLKNGSFERLGIALVGLGLLFASLDVVVLALQDERSARFTPIHLLNPISAAQVTALGAVACVALNPTSSRGRLAQGAAFGLLVAASIVPASRGVILALAVALLAVLLLVPRRALRLLPALALGVLLGLFAAGYSGSSYYLGFGLPLVDDEAPPTGPDFSGVRGSPTALAAEESISTVAIRRYLVKKALRAVPEAPLLGHGVGALVDDSPEARRMIRSGELDADETRTYPHNVFVEAAYSLGLLGLGPLLACVALTARALLRTVRRAREGATTTLAVAFVAFAAVSANVSGALGSDAYFWVALALPIGIDAAQQSRERRPGAGEASAT